MMTIIISSAVPCMLVALFIGPWSDKNGRKPVMMIPTVGRGTVPHEFTHKNLNVNAVLFSITLSPLHPGYILTSLYFLLNIYFLHWKAEYLIVATVFSVFGSDSVFLIGI